MVLEVTLTIKAKVPVTTDRLVKEGDAPLEVGPADICGETARVLQQFLERPDFLAAHPGAKTTVEGQGHGPYGYNVGIGYSHTQPDTTEVKQEATETEDHSGDALPYLMMGAPVLRGDRHAGEGDPSESLGKGSTGFFPRLPGMSDPAIPIGVVCINGRFWRLR